MTLPQRIFHNPLARALVEQRAATLSSIRDTAPAKSKPRQPASRSPDVCRHPGQYLSNGAGQDLARAAHSDAELLDVAALLWAMAQQIENGDASKAE